jgi:hypothetical protein
LRSDAEFFICWAEDKMEMQSPTSWICYKGFMDCGQQN